MEFKTKDAETAYREMLTDVSERAIRMYADVKRMNLEPHLAFSLNMAVEQFQYAGLAKAIEVGTSVDATWAGLSGSIALASMRGD